MKYLNQVFALVHTYNANANVRANTRKDTCEQAQRKCKRKCIRNEKFSIPCPCICVALVHTFHSLHLLCLHLHLPCTCEPGLMQAQTQASEGPVRHLGKKSPPVFVTFLAAAFYVCCVCACICILCVWTRSK